MGRRAAQRYAKALYSLSKESDNTNAVCEDMKQIASVLAGSKDLAAVLKSPVIKVELKESVVLEIFKSAQELTHNTIKVLAANGRIQFLKWLAVEYIAIFEIEHKIQRAKVTTATKLTPELEKEIQDKVQELTGSKAMLSTIIDNDIIGGFILQVNDLQYDASISGSFSHLKQEILSKR
ncbi:MAG: ATP synthase F1 subunit delta [Bacteroidota bacterium]